MPGGSKKSVRDRLARLGPERLAEALDQLSQESEEASDLVHRLTDSPSEIRRRFKSQLAGLKRQRRFVPWRESGAYAKRLVSMLEDVRTGVRDPETGAELVAAFYQCDKHIFDHCDDSSGTVGDVFRFDARDLFVHYAAGCENKPWLADLVFRLTRDDDYGVRDAVIERAGEYLPPEEMRRLADRIWEASQADRPEREGTEARNHSRFHGLILVGLLAKQLRDPVLFERSRRALHPELGTAACLDIARAYFEADDAETALRWLERIPESEHFKAYERDELLRQVHAKLSNREEVERLCWKKFRRYTALQTLDQLLSVIGTDRRDEVISGAIRTILGKKEFHSTDAAFLIDTGRIDEAESYLVDRREQLDGDHYTSLLPLADGMLERGRPLGASLVYRALLDSILKRAISRYYHHGVRYLKRLDRLAPSVQDWRGVPTHEDYVSSLRQVHGRKSAFWAKYEP